MLFSEKTKNNNPNAKTMIPERRNGVIGSW